MSIEDLDRLWAARLSALPQESGRIIQLCVRPDLNKRLFSDTLDLCPLRGAIGDRWEHRTWMYLPDGRPDPRVQVALMDHRVLTFLQALTGCNRHPGDTLLVDLGLHAGRFPTGIQIQVGSAVIEISDVENDACAKFAAHYGADVLAWMRAPLNRVKRLRGAFAKVVQPGQARVGDIVRPAASPLSAIAMQPGPRPA